MTRIQILEALGGLVFVGGIAAAGGVGAYWLDWFDVWLILAPTIAIGLFASLVYQDRNYIRRGNARPQALSPFAFYYSAVLATAAMGSLFASSIILGVIGLDALIPKPGVVVQWISEFPAKPWFIALTGVGTVIVGAIFFYFRLRQRFLYGMFEAITGSLIAAHRISVEPVIGIPTDTGFYVAVLTAGVYLVVRGLDNMHQAISADDPVAHWCLAKAKSLNQRLRTAASTPPKAGDE